MCVEATGKVNFDLTKFVHLFDHKNEKCFIGPAPLTCQFVGRQFLLLPPIWFQKVASSLRPVALSAQVRPQ